MTYPRLSPLSGIPGRLCADRFSARRGRTMANVTREYVGAKSGRASSEAVQFRILYAICFSLFLFGGVLQKLMPWRWFGTRKENRSVIEQARDAAGLCATYAFMA